MNLFFDTETTGVPKRYNAPVSDVENYPRLVQLGFVVTNGREILLEQEFIIKPVGFEIPEQASAVHGISTERALREGVDIQEVLETLEFWITNCDVIVGHNVSFDMSVVGAEFWRLHQRNPFDGKDFVCTMKSSTEFCQLPGGRPFKYPKLFELYKKLFDKDMGAAHTALQDIQNTVDCYFALVERGIIK